MTGVTVNRALAILQQLTCSNLWPDWIFSTKIRATQIYVNSTLTLTSELTPTDMFLDLYRVISLHIRINACMIWVPCIDMMWSMCWTSNGSWCMMQGWNVRHGLCHFYMRYVYKWVLYNFCLFCCLFIIVTWGYVWCIEWASGNQEEVQACLVTLWLFSTSCYSLYKTTLSLSCSWFENNPYFHKYSTDFHV